jgi:hypothetical protein
MDLLRLRPVVDEGPEAGREAGGERDRITRGKIVETLSLATAAAAASVPQVPVECQPSPL